MASVIEVFNATKLLIHTEQNGELTVSDFNTFSKLAELRMIDWLTGKPGADGKPIITPYDNQKNRDWLSPFILKHAANVSNGIFIKPAGYYQLDSFAKLIVKRECEDESDGEVIEKTIDVLAGPQFRSRLETSIELLKPKNKPCATGDTSGFRVAPADMGGAVLYYIAYPVYGKIVSKVDEEFNEEVPDENASINYQWGDWCIPVLSWMIENLFSDRVRDASLKNMNNATGKLES